MWGKILGAAGCACLWCLASPASAQTATSSCSWVGSQWVCYSDPGVQRQPIQQPQNQLNWGLLNTQPYQPAPPPYPPQQPPQQPYYGR